MPDVDDSHAPRCMYCGDALLSLYGLLDYIDARFHEGRGCRTPAASLMVLDIALQYVRADLRHHLGLCKSSVPPHHHANEPRVTLHFAVRPEGTFTMFDDKTRLAGRPQAPAHVPAAIAQLKIISSPDGSQVGRSWQLRGDQETTLGRDQDNSIALNDPDVSRHHCRVITREAQHLLIDTQSTNGTLVNGQKVTEAKLRFGDKLLIGSTALLYVAP